MHDVHARTAVNDKRHKAAYTPKELHSLGMIPMGLSGIYRGLHDGTIPSIKFGKKFVIPRAAIDQWLRTAGGNA